MRHLILVCIALIVSALLPPATPAQTPALPRVELRSATVLRLPGEVDSNSPAVWDRVDGETRMFVMTSVAGRPSTASGHTLARLGTAEPIVLKLSTPDIILEGIRRIDRWSRIERAVGTLDTPYERVEGYETVLRQMTLSPDKLNLLTTLSSVQDLGTICRRSTLPHFDVCRTIWSYRVIGVVRRLE